MVESGILSFMVVVFYIIYVFSVYVSIGFFIGVFREIGVLDLFMYMLCNFEF